MLRFVSYDIVFQEVPSEVSLAINISGCPNRCDGCHSRYLWEDRGEVLDEASLSRLLDVYLNAVTCICFMGGDNSPSEVEKMAGFVKEKSNGRLKICWYSGKDVFPNECSLQNFDYLKLGAFVEDLGGLDKATTNQKFFKIKNDEMIDMTDVFVKVYGNRFEHF